MASLVPGFEGVTLVDFAFGRPFDPRWPRVFFLCRDPGDWNALVHLIVAMRENRPWKPYALLTGSALEMFKAVTFPEEREKFLQIKDIRFLVDLAPSVFVTSSSCSDPHLQLAARRAFPWTPMVYVEDNYRMRAPLFAALKAEKLKLPDFVCCIDGNMLEDLTGSYPAFERCAAATGQPEFDRVMAEGQDVRQAARERLVLGDAKLAVFMGSPDNGALVPALAQALASRKCRTPIVFTVRRHPRDESRTDAAYAEIFDGQELPYLSTEEESIETVAAAADLVLGVASTEVVKAALRLIPAAYVLDARYVEKPASVRFPIPPTRSGAALYYKSVEEAADMVAALLQPSSKDDLSRAQMLRRKQKNFRDRQPTKAIDNILGHIRELLST